MRALFALLCLISVAWAVEARREARVAETTRRATVAFLAGLDESQAALASFEFEDDERENWNFVPMQRKGIELRRLSSESRRHVARIWESVMSELGREKVREISTTLELVLRELESRPDRPARHRDPLRFTVAVFGDPEGRDPWGWRFEGHHLSLNFTIHGEEVIGVTPLFLGANPARVARGPHEGLRVLSAEHEAAWRLFESLDEEQRALAVISDESPSDIVLGPGGPRRFETSAGISLMQLSESQLALFEDLFAAHLDNLAPELAARHRERMGNALPTKTFFAWAGAGEPTKQHYYRIQTEHTAIEYCTTVADANHVHVVWHDFENDFGADALRRHLEAGHAEER